MRFARSLVIACTLGSLAACQPPGYHKGDDASDDGMDGMVPDAAPVDGVPGLDGATADGPLAVACTKQFVLTGYGSAGSVWLTGDFTSWATSPGGGAIELAIDGSGAWAVSHEFAVGTYAYKFIVDSSTWITDPNAETMDDGMGNTNSVYRCSP